MDVFLAKGGFPLVKVAEVFGIGIGEVTPEQHAVVLFRVLSFLSDPSLYEPIPSKSGDRRKIILVLGGGGGRKTVFFGVG